MRKFTLQISIALLTFFLIDSCAKNPVTGKREFMLISKKQEQAMGDQADPDIVRQFGLYNDAQLQNFINQKGNEMARISHRPDLKYEFKIMDSPVVNAFALPGGYVYFTRGIMAHFNNEAEFAGVLGHEIGHITARHSAKQYSKAILGQAGLILGVIVSEKFRPYAESASQGMQLLFLKFGRDNESQSDMLGVQYSTTIGYDSENMAHFFKTLSRLSGEGGGVPTFLSTHPDPLDRFEKVGELTKEAQQPGKQYQENRNSYLQMIDGLVYGEDPRQGYVLNSTFYHPELKFQFPVPGGWKTANSPTQFQMAPESGDAMMILTLAQGSDLNAAAQAFVQNNQLTLKESRNVDVNGFPALAVISDQIQQQQGAAQTQTTQGAAKTTDNDGTVSKSGSSTSSGGKTTKTETSGTSSGSKSGSTSTTDKEIPSTGASSSGTSQGQSTGTPTVRILSYFIQYDNNIYVIHGLAEYANFSRYQRMFESTMTNFKKLTDPARINVSPDRIHIETVPRNGTLESILKGFNMPQDKLEELSILNGMELNDQVTKGMLIKTIGK